VHLASIGHPVIGDDRYGSRPAGARGQQQRPAGARGQQQRPAGARGQQQRPAGGRAQATPTLPGLSRPWLHAEALAFDHPVDGRRLSFTSPLPPDLTATLTTLHALDR
jgi:23S rRNA-/tRNA-specific pseudouridylate synthase